MLYKNQVISSWPIADRPREKLLSHGSKGLSNTELLAILLGTGTKGVSAMDLARQIQLRLKSLREMSRASISDWHGLPGLGRAKRARLEAAMEIGRRLAEEGARQKFLKVRSSENAAELLMPRLRDLKKEVFMATFLNAQNEVIISEEIAQGTVNMATPILREIFERALHHHAVSMICYHNHPSGNSSPSPEDRQFTRELAAAGRIMQIKVLDHLIIGDNTYYSFADQGLL